jgi:hypothetical protein
MSDLWERFKAWWNSPSTDVFYVYESTREARQKELRAARIKQARAELRDRFAAAALTGLLANPFLLESMSEIMKKNGDEFSKKYRNFTELAYFHADAMMKAREK